MESQEGDGGGVFLLSKHSVISALPMLTVQPVVMMRADF